LQNTINCGILQVADNDSKLRHNSIIFLCNNEALAFKLSPSIIFRGKDLRDVTDTKHPTGRSDDPSNDPTASIYKRYPVRRGLVGWAGFAAGMLCSRLFVRIRAVGTHHIPKDPPYVIAPNHVTYVDGMWAGSYLPHGHFSRFCCMAAKELEDSHGALGRLIMKVGRGIAADRFGNPVRALILAKQQLEQKQILLLHPEGTRSPDGQLGEFKDGAAYLAIKAHCPLLPVYVAGGYEVYNRHMKWPQPFAGPFRRKHVTIVFGAPLLPENYKSASEMTAALLQSILELREKYG
jgi:1-acyl-sn-glycerol-3-phosphate acyltransferase